MCLALRLSGHKFELKEDINNINDHLLPVTWRQLFSDLGKVKRYKSTNLYIYIYIHTVFIN